MRTHDLVNVSSIIHLLENLIFYSYCWENGEVEPFDKDFIPFEFDDEQYLTDKYIYQFIVPRYNQFSQSTKEVAYNSLRYYLRGCPR